MRGKGKRASQVAVWCLLLVTVGMIFMVNRLVPFMMDDLWYSTLLSEDTPITSLSDILYAQVWHYFNWGGRSMTHTILQLTLLLGEIPADVLNTLVTILLAFLICKVAGWSGLPTLLVALGMLIGFNANWKMSMFWQAGAANYLYIAIFQVLYVLVYVRELQENELVPKPLPGIALWILPLGLLAGWSNENMGPALFCLGVFVMWQKHREEERIPLWMILGSASCLIGSVLMIVAPGNFVRSDEVEENSYGALWQVFLRCYAEAKGLCEYLFPTLLVLAFVLILYRFVLQEHLAKKDAALLGTAILSWGALLLSPHYPDRAAFGTMVLLICEILFLAKRIVDKREDLKLPLFWAAIFIWLRAMYFLGEFAAISWGWIK